MLCIKSIKLYEYIKSIQIQSICVHPLDLSSSGQAILRTRTPQDVCTPPARRNLELDVKDVSCVFGRCFVCSWVSSWVCMHSVRACVYIYIYTYIILIYTYIIIYIYIYITII